MLLVLEEKVDRGSGESRLIGDLPQRAVVYAALTEYLLGRIEEVDPVLATLGLPLCSSLGSAVRLGRDLVHCTHATRVGRARPPCCSRGSDRNGQKLMAPNLQAVEPPGRLVAVEFDRTRALEQALQHDLALQPGQGSTDAVVDAAAEGHVAPGQATMEVDGIGLWECRGVPIGGSPEQQHGRPRRDGYVP